MGHLLFIHSSVDGCPGCFHIWTIINSDTMNIGVPASFRIRTFIFAGFMLRSRIVGSSGKSLFRFLRNLHTVFHTCWTSLLSHWQCSRVLFFPFSLQYLLHVRFLMVAILTSVKWHFTVDFICISLIISDIEHLFMCLWTIYMSSLEKDLFMFSVYFLIRLFGFLALSFMNCLYILEIKPL